MNQTSERHSQKPTARKIHKENRKHYHFGPDLPKSAGLSDHDLFAIAHLASNLAFDLHVSGFHRATSSGAKLSLVGLYGSSARSMSTLPLHSWVRWSQSWGVASLVERLVEGPN